MNMGSGIGAGVGGLGGKGPDCPLPLKVTERTMMRTMATRIPPPMTEYFITFFFWALP